MFAPSSNDLAPYPGKIDFPLTIQYISYNSSLGSMLKMNVIGFIAFSVAVILINVYFYKQEMYVVYFLYY